MGLLKEIFCYSVAGLVGITIAMFIGEGIDTSKIKSSLKPVIIEEDVIGNKIPDKFYYTGGKRAYIEIDGKPIEEYFRK